MSANLIRTMSSTGRPHIKRGVFSLSGGQRVMIIQDTNLIGIFISADQNAAWTFVRNITTTVGATGFFACSGSVDANDGLHIAWHNTDNSLQYWYAPYASGTYGAGTQTVLEAGSSSPPDSIDIDCPGSPGKHKYTVVTTHFAKSAGTTSYAVYVVRDTDASHWSAYGPDTFTDTGGSLVNRVKPDITVQTLKNIDTTAAGIKIPIAICVTTSPGANDLGDRIYTFLFYTSDNSFSTVSTYNLNTSGKAGGVRKYFMFIPPGGTTGYLVGTGGTNFRIAVKFTLSTAGVFTVKGSPSINSDNVLYPSTDGSAGTAVGGAPVAGQTLYFGAAFLPNITTAIIFAPSRANAYANATVTFNSDDTISWDTYLYNWEGPSISGSLFSGMYAGDSRNQNKLLNVARAGTYAAGNAFRVDIAKISAAPAQKTTKPLSTIATSFPTLEARYYLNDDFPKTKYKMGWDIGTDPNFGAGSFTSYVQSDSDFSIPLLTVQGIDVRASLAVPSRIAQNTWNIRSYAIDKFGNKSAYSPFTQFTIFHAPSYSNPNPQNDAAVAYGTGQIVFTWNFSDPSPGDTQTAYQIDVVRTDTAATVASTGVVSSSSQAASVTIPSSLKDIELAWQLTVFDTDGQESNLTYQSVFYVSDPPMPAITSPATGASITSGQPLITWTPGIAGAKSQTRYRLQVSQGNSVLYDSNWINGSNTSVSVPPGVLHNLQNYTLRIFIQDSVGMQATSSIQVSTNYPVPASVNAFAVFADEFDRYGFMHIGWEYTSYDNDFLSWNVYRQGIGEANPTLVAQFTELRPSYGFRDYSAKANTTYSYWITQMVNRYGDLVESNVGKIVQLTTPGLYYWLLDSIGAVAPTPLFLCNDDSWTDEHEESVTTIINRGRHVDIGTHVGKNGSLGVQCRDRYVGFDIGNNWVPNPSLQYAADGYNPDGWTLTPHGTAANYTSGFATFYEPTPSGKYTPFGVTLDSLGNTSADWLDVAAPRIKVGDTDWHTGSAIMISKWLGSAPSNDKHYYLKIKLSWIGSDGTTVLSTTTTTATISEVYNNFGTLITGGSWTRWFINGTVPANAAYLDVTYQIFTTTTATEVIFFGGAMVSTGTTLIHMFDGDSPGCTWIKQPGSGSFSPGNYSARDQRLDVEFMKELNRPLYLRNPFGDLLLVSLGDEANARVPGVGSRDFDNMTLPYREVAP